MAENQPKEYERADEHEITSGARERESLTCPAFDLGVDDLFGHPLPSGANLPGNQSKRDRNLKKWSPFFKVRTNTVPSKELLLVHLPSQTSSLDLYLLSDCGH